LTLYKPYYATLWRVIGWTYFVLIRTYILFTLKLVLVLKSQIAAKVGHIYSENFRHITFPVADITRIFITSQIFKIEKNF